MYSSIKLGWLYIKYWLSASNGKGHGIHSPFVFELVTKVFNDNRKFYAFELIESRRNALLVNDEVISVVDFGAGSRNQLNNKRVVKKIASSSLKPKKYGQLLFRLVNYFMPETILELGTSLGVTSCYLAAGNTNAKLITMEGSQEIAKIAKKSFEAAQLSNIQLVEGSFDTTLIQTLRDLGKVNFIFLDGNHRYEPTIRYFNHLLQHIDDQSVAVIDDIHWSIEMEKAWDQIKKHETVTLTIDLFFVGLVFFRKEQAEKAHFVIRY